MPRDGSTERIGQRAERRVQRVGDVLVAPAVLKGDKAPELAGCVYRQRVTRFDTLGVQEILTRLAERGGAAGDFDALPQLRHESGEAGRCEEFFGLGRWRRAGGACRPDATLRCSHLPVDGSGPVLDDLNPV